ncbi:hypothetical protein ACI65C_013441 [Semiaphis heraclei]
MLARLKSKDSIFHFTGYTPKVRLLKPDAVPTLHLPLDHSQSVTSTSTINRNKRIEAKSMKRVNFKCSIFIVSNITSTSAEVLSPSLDIYSSDSTPFPEKLDYEKLYNDLLEKHNELKLENDKHKDKILSLEEPLENYKKINECLRTRLSSLQRWAKTIEMRNGILGDVLKIMKLNGDTLKDYEKLALINDTKLNNDTADFIELVNNWFDLANVCHPNDKQTPFTAPYGLKLEEHDALLNKVYETFLNMKCIGKQSLQLFRKALLMNINFRAHPIADQNQEEFLVAAAFKQTDFNFKGELEIHELQEIMSNDSETDTASENESQVKESRNNSEMTNDAVEYLAGWMPKKHKLKFPEIGSITAAKKSRATIMNMIMLYLLGLVIFLMED